MKIMQIIPTLELAGAEIMCENLTAEISKTNEVVVVSMYDRKTPITKRLSEKGIKIVFLDKKKGPDIRMIGALKKVILAEKPDVIHTHLDCLKYAYAAGTKAGVRRFIHTVHNVADKEATGLTAKINGYLFNKKGVVPVALSSEIRDSIASMYGLAKTQIPVVFNGIDLEKCRVKNDYNGDGILHIIHVGRFRPQKNHDLLIKAFSDFAGKYPKCDLTLLGDGELEDNIKKLVADLGVSDKVHFEGSKDNVFPYLNKADVFVLPSLYEGVPMSVIEAMGTGLPIIASNVGGIPDMLKDGENAVLINPDKDVLTDAFMKMTDVSFREKLGKAALSGALEKFSAAAMAGSYMKIYNA